MNYGFWLTVIICLAAFTLVLNIVYLILARRRAGQLGILRVKYPIWDHRAALSAFILFCCVFVVVMSIVDLPRYIAKLADYQVSFEQDPGLYSHYIEPMKNTIEHYKFDLVCGAAIAVLELLTIFTSGAYITKEGVMFFGRLKPMATAARIEDGAIKFYTRTLREAKKDREYRYAFELPENEDNKMLVNSFIPTDTHA